MANHGVLFVATGDAYRGLAFGAAESLRRADPDVPIDLFTDRAVAPGPFDRVEILAAPWRRSKLDALLLTRFERTVFLDADVFVLAPLGEIFETLERFDIAAAHDPDRNGEPANALWRKPLPPSFPQFNTGVLAYRNSPEVRALLTAWRDAVRDGDLPRDQPAFRELMWDSRLRFATLPEEFNLIRYRQTLLWGRTRLAPRILHSPRLHHHFTRNRGRPIRSVEALVGPMIATVLEALAQGDRFLAASRGTPRRVYGAAAWRMVQVRAVLRGAAGLVMAPARRIGAPLRRLVGRR